MWFMYLPVQTRKGTVLAVDAVVNQTQTFELQHCISMWNNDAQTFVSSINDYNMFLSLICLVAGSQVWIEDELQSSIKFIFTYCTVAATCKPMLMPCPLAPVTAP